MGIVFNQDNARPLTSLVSRQKIRKLGWWFAWWRVGLKKSCWKSFVPVFCQQRLEFHFKMVKSYRAKRCIFGMYRIILITGWLSTRILLSIKICIHFDECSFFFLFFGISQLLGRRSVGIITLRHALLTFCCKLVSERAICFIQIEYFVVKQKKCLKRQLKAFGELLRNTCRPVDSPARCGRCVYAQGDISRSRMGEWQGLQAK